RGHAAAGRSLGGPAARGADGRGAALGACRGRRGAAPDTGAATPAGSLGWGGCRRGTAGHAATVSAAGRSLVAFCDTTGPRRLPGRRHGPGQDDPGAGAVAVSPPQSIRTAAYAV